jgi:hypothetical protein
MDQVTSQLEKYCVMETSFYTELEEAGLVSTGKIGVSIALTSRDICSVSSFLKKGQGVLDTLSNEYKMHNELDKSEEDHARMLKQERLVLAIDIKHLRQMRETLYWKWSQSNNMVFLEFVQNNYGGGGSLGLLLTRLQEHRTK